MGSTIIPTKKKLSQLEVSKTKKKIGSMLCETLRLVATSFKGFAIQR